MSSTSPLSTPRSTSSATSMEFEDRDNYQLLVNRFLNDDEQKTSPNNPLPHIRRFNYPSPGSSPIANMNEYGNPQASIRGTLSKIPSGVRLEDVESKEEEKENDIRNIEETKFNNDNKKRGKKIDPRVISKSECKQIMFLYNSKSGGQKALTLLKYFKAYTLLLYDLLDLNSSKEEREKLAQDLIKWEGKLVICAVGGDGSQCWAASLIDRTIDESVV